jgi:hypothetical protein
MARITAHNGLFLDTVGASQDGESVKKWAQEEKKLHADKGWIYFLNKKIPCPCLNEAKREARQNLPNTGHDCMWRGCRMILPKTELMICSGCNIWVYCSRDCQKTDWETHKTFCGIVDNGNHADLINT